MTGETLGMEATSAVSSLLYPPIARSTSEKKQEKRHLRWMQQRDWAGENRASYDANNAGFKQDKTGIYGDAASW